MNTLKNYQYSDNSRFLDRQLLKFQSQPSFGRKKSSNHSNIPQLKRQMIQVLTEPKSSYSNLSPTHTHTPKPPHNKYPSYISLMKSNISLPSNPRDEHQPLTSIKLLEKLQVQLMEEILMLKQDKLTLKEEYNRVLGNRFQVERQVGIVRGRVQREGKQEKQEKQGVKEIVSFNDKEKFSDMSIFDGLRSTEFQLENRTSNKFSNKLNEELYLNFSKENNQQGHLIIKNQPKSRQQIQSQYQKEIQRERQKQRERALTTQSEKQSQSFLMSQIQKLQQSSRVIQKKITYLQTISDRNSLQQINNNFNTHNRFQTFFPQENKFAKSQVITDRNALLSQLSTLQQHKDKLYTNLANRIPSYNQRSYFYQLIQQNRQLSSKMEKLYATQTYTQRNQNQFLVQHIKKEQLAKQNFFEDLAVFKQQIGKIKRQNYQLRSKLGF